MIWHVMAFVWVGEKRVSSSVLGGQLLRGAAFGSG